MDASLRAYANANAILENMRDVNWAGLNMCHQTKQGARGKTPLRALEGIFCRWDTREHDHGPKSTPTSSTS
jgi:hypothetical protein